MSFAGELAVWAVVFSSFAGLVQKASANGEIGLSNLSSDGVCNADEGFGSNETTERTGKTRSAVSRPNWGSRSFDGTSSETDDISVFVSDRMHIDCGMDHVRARLGLSWTDLSLLSFGSLYTIDQFPEVSNLGCVFMVLRGARKQKIA